MIDLQALKGLILAKKKTYAECAEHIGISTTSFTNKMNGVTKFYVDELNSLGDFLGLNNKAKIEIFLPSILHDTQDKKSI